MDIDFVFDDAGAPAGWSRVEERSPLFGRSVWFDLMDDGRGSPVWCAAYRDGVPLVGFRGVVVREGEPSDTRDPFALLFDEVPAVRTLDPETLGRLDAARPASGPSGWFPALVFCYPGYDSFPIGDPSLGRDVLTPALEQLVARAAQERVGSVAFLYVDPAQVEFEAALGDAGFLPFASATRADLELPGETFDDYCAALTGNQRANLRKVGRTLEDAGVTVGVRPLAEELERVLALRLLHKERHGRRVDERAERALLEAFAGPELGERVTLFVADAAGKILGFALFLWDDVMWHAMFTGSDYDDPRHKNAYFELMFYAPIRHAYEHGIGPLSFGYGTEEAKRRRGCTVTVARSWIVPIDPDLRPSVERAAAILGEWADAFPRRRAPTPVLEAVASPE